MEYCNYSSRCRCNSGYLAGNLEYMLRFVQRVISYLFTTFTSTKEVMFLVRLVGLSIGGIMQIVMDGFL